MQEIEWMLLAEEKINLQKKIATDQEVDVVGRWRIRWRTKLRKYLLLRPPSLRHDADAKPDDDDTCADYGDDADDADDA